MKALFSTADFPILDQRVYGHPLTYLDSANTSLTPDPVLQSMDEYYREYNANIHRAVYPLGEKATLEHENAREKLRQFIKAESVQEIIFTRNATEGINLVAKTWGKQNLKQGDTILLSIMEHHSNIVPWQMLAQENGLEIQYLGINHEGRLDLEEYNSLLKNEKIRMVGVTHQSNVLGTINPVKEMIQLAHEQGSKVLVDGAQAVPHMPIDVQYLSADFYVFTGHKMCGPTGIGVLYAKKTLLEEMPPFLGGGEMIRTVTTEGSTWNDLPYKFEAGTPHISGAIGLGAAVDYLNALDMTAVQSAEKRLLDYALKQVQNLHGLRLYGPQESDMRGSA
ncbi:MAG: aminotransferase class V-fold PLP-dependent enzyme, partial [Candidatus Gracilibacteria bacterium]|nr:aminotransferase class V-fold PLP-dependent enzyme [Candidatus Gracilibacteria bacterium]